MALKFFRLIFSLTLIFTASLCINAQIDASTSNGRPPKEEIPKGIKETLKKHEIERMKKEYDELLKNGEEAFKLSEEIEKSFDENQRLSQKDNEKLNQLEKLLKKIRNKLGGDDDKEEEKLSSFQTAIKSLKDTAADLLDELKKTSRYSISAIAIQSSNSLLKIVRFIKLGGN
ncbi:MAG TPA: hypothetical protein VK892_13460 [Pyrinomonadaceae bacterium]|nr:hypothetical protein [Pyrinomonadaceae bacterium]